MAAPLVAGTFAVFLVAILLCLSGVAEIMGALRGPPAHGGTLHLVSGALSVLGGLFLFAQPVLTLGILTLILGIYLFLDGFGKCLFAFQVKPQQGWGIVFTGGMLTLLLGGFILSRWPLSGERAIGILIGINMFISGGILSLLSQGLKLLAEQVDDVEAQLAAEAKPVEEDS